MMPVFSSGVYWVWYVRASSVFRGRKVKELSFSLLAGSVLLHRSIIHLKLITSAFLNAELINRMLLLLILLVLILAEWLKVRGYVMWCKSFGSWWFVAHLAAWPALGGEKCFYWGGLHHWGRSVGKSWRMCLTERKNRGVTVNTRVSRPEREEVRVSSQEPEPEPEPNNRRTWELTSQGFRKSSSSARDSERKWTACSELKLSWRFLHVSITC